MATVAAPKLDDANKTLAAAQPSQHHTQSPPSQPLDPNKKASIGPHAPANSTLTNSGEDAPGNDSKAKAVTAMAEVTSGDGDSDSASNIQKKMRRAERFGVPVMLSEEEKRNSRAERFGTIYASYGSHVLKKSEEQKRKARAERFGIAQSATDDEDSKKKARLARFAPALKTDSVEEDRRKARAIRFSQSSSSSMSHVNSKGDIEPKPAIAGKAGGTD